MVGYKSMEMNAETSKNSQEKSISQEKIERMKKVFIKNKNSQSCFRLGFKICYAVWMMK